MTTGITFLIILGLAMVIFNIGCQFRNWAIEGTVPADQVERIRKEKLGAFLMKSLPPIDDKKFNVRPDNAQFDFICETISGSVINPRYMAAHALQSYMRGYEDVLHYEEVLDRAMRYTLDDKGKAEDEMAAIERRIKAMYSVPLPYGNIGLVEAKQNKRNVECLMCHGDGHKNDYICQFCHGSGYKEIVDTGKLVC